MVQREEISILCSHVPVHSKYIWYVTPHRLEYSSYCIHSNSAPQLPQIALDLDIYEAEHVQSSFQYFLMVPIRSIQMVLHTCIFSFKEVHIDTSVNFLNRIYICWQNIDRRYNKNLRDYCFNFLADCNRSSCSRNEIIFKPISEC